MMTVRTIARAAAAAAVASAVSAATPALAQDVPQPAPQPFVVVPSVPAVPADAAAPTPPAPPAPAPFVVAPHEWDVDVDIDGAYVALPALSEIQAAVDNIHVADGIVFSYAGAYARQAPAPRPAQPAQAPQPPQPPRTVVIGPWTGGTQTPERLYSQGRNAIETNRYEQAIEIFTQLAAMQSEFQDAASYWRAYSFYKVARTADALTALRDFQQQFKQSRWLNDARALEAEVKQSAGQPISADAAASDDIKLMAARGLIQSDPDKAIPVLERMLSSASSPRLKEQTLFVLSQTNAPRAREIVVSAAKGSHNPDVQVQAIRHIGMMGNTQVRLLADIYRESNDTNVKRAVIRSLGAARGRTELLAVARAEENAELRADAIRQLRGLQASEELQELYRNEKSPEVRRRILEGLTDARFTKWLTEIARQETDPEVKRVAIQSLAQTRSPEVTDTLLAIYASDNSAETRRAVLSAFQMANNGRALVDLARKETDPARKRDIVQRLSMMRGQPEVTEYLLELLK